MTSYIKSFEFPTPESRDAFCQKLKDLDGSLDFRKFTFLPRGSQEVQVAVQLSRADIRETIEAAPKGTVMEQALRIAHGQKEKKPSYETAWENLAVESGWQKPAQPYTILAI